MKKLLLLLILSLFSIQSHAGSCPDGSEPVKSISDDGTYFVFNCGGGNNQSSSNGSWNDPGPLDELTIPDNWQLFKHKETLRDSRESFEAFTYSGFGETYNKDTCLNVVKDWGQSMKTYNSIKKQLDDATKFGGEGGESKDLQGCIDRFIYSTQNSAGTPDYMKEILLHWAKTDAVFIPSSVKDENWKSYVYLAVQSWSSFGSYYGTFYDEFNYNNTERKIVDDYIKKKLLNLDTRNQIEKGRQACDPNDLKRTVEGQLYFPGIDADSCGSSVWKTTLAQLLVGLRLNDKDLFKKGVENTKYQLSFFDDKGIFTTWALKGANAYQYSSSVPIMLGGLTEIYNSIGYDFMEHKLRNGLSVKELMDRQYEILIDPHILDSYVKRYPIAYRGVPNSEYLQSSAEQIRNENGDNLFTFVRNLPRYIDTYRADIGNSQEFDKKLSSQPKDVWEEVPWKSLGAFQPIDPYLVYISDIKQPVNKLKMLEGGIRSSNINFPGKFYTTEISACKAVVPVTFSSNSFINFVKALVGYDWHADWEANSNSMNVYHQKITEPMNMLMAATHNALGNDNQANINTAKNLLIELAKTDTLYDSIGYIEVKKKPGCYAGGDINAPCWYHQYQFASNVFSNYMITAIWLKDELNQQEFEIVDKYIKKMYKKFLHPIELQEEEQGFYAMANGGTSILAYASWTNDKELAVEEIDHRFKEMDRLFYDDGYINNNSFRGYRGQWYHSYGLDIALGYVYIAELWGAEIPNKLQNKLVKAAEVANLAITNWNQFKSRKYDGNQSNAIEDPNNAVKHTHQMAIAIDTLMKIVTDVELESDPVYLQKRRYQIGKSYGIDELIGFPPNCTLEALTINPETTAEKVKLEQAKPISGDGEIHIVDGVQYQIEGQNLKVYTGNSKIKPLNRHMGGLMMKCGSGLITGKKKDWLSFVSSESNDIKKARNQNCHYQYFQKSKDSEAFDLFNAISSSTDSILDQLEKI